MPHRTYSRSFKLDLVRRIATGAIRPAQVCRDDGIHPSTLSQWRQEYAVRGEAAFTPSAPASVDVLKRRVAELERRCRHLAQEK